MGSICFPFALLGFMIPFPAEVEKAIEGSLQVASAALAYQGADEIYKALASVTQAIHLHPEFSEAILLKSELQIKRGDLDLAVVSLKQLIQKFPGLTRARYLLASAFVHQKKFDEAVKLYTALADADPQNPEPLFLMGWSCLSQKRTDEARRAFEKALQLSAQDFRVIEQLINMDFVEKRYDQALQRLEKYRDLHRAEPQLLRAKVFIVQQDFVQAEAALFKAIECEPHQQSAYVMLVRIYLQSQRKSQALKTLTEMVEKNPRDITGLTLLGMLHEQDQAFDAARDVYRQALEIDPRSSVVLNNLAFLCAERYGNLEEAYELARKAREAAPQDPSIADTLGWILYKKGEFVSALGLLRESASQLPSNPEAQFHWGCAASRMGEESAARNAFRRALEGDKDFGGRAEAIQRLAILDLNFQKNPVEVRKKLEKRLGEQPDDLVVQVRWAEACEREGDMARAVEGYEHALKLNPTHVKALFALAKVYSDHLHNPQKAIDLAQAAYKLEPEDAEITYLLGRLAYEMRNYPWALSLLQG